MSYCKLTLPCFLIEVVQSSDGQRVDRYGVSVRDELRLQMKIMLHPTAQVESEDVGSGTRIWAFVHVLKGAKIGRNCNIGDHCFVEGGVKVGNDVVIKNAVSLWTGVSIEDRCFIGPSVVFTNDNVPRAGAYREQYDRTLIREGASIGANATLICPLEIGRYALVGAGAVVTESVPDFGLVFGTPARMVGYVCKCGQRLSIGLDEDRTTRCSCGLTYEKTERIVVETL